MQRFIVELKEVHSVPVEVECPDGATKDEILELAAKKFEENGSDTIEYSHTLGRDAWTVRDAESGDYL